MNVVDSSGWLECFADGPNASHFAEPLEDQQQLIVPAVSIYEVFKVLLRERGEDAAFQGVAAMQQATVVELTATLAMSAASLSLQHSLPPQERKSCSRRLILRPHRCAAIQSVPGSGSKAYG